MALEVTGSAWEIAGILEPHVRRVIVVSPDDTGIRRARAKTDRLDARTLARLLWAGRLDAVWMPDERCRLMRRRLARRERLVRSRSRAKNEIHAVLVRRLTGKPLVSDLFGVKGRGWLRERELPVEEAERLEGALRHVEFLDAEIAAVERLIAREALRWADARRLLTVPGVNLICAASFLAAIDDVRRFRTARQLVALSHQRNDTRRSFVIDVANGVVWVAIWKSGEILGVDSATGDIKTRLRQRFPGVDGAAIGNGAMWVSTPGALTRVDVATHTTTAMARIPGPHQRVVLGGGYVWTANLYRGEVYQVDEAGHVTHTYSPGVGSWKLSYSDGTLWVGHLNNVTAIDATTGSTRTYRVVGTATAVAAGAGRVLALTLPQENILPAVDGLRGRVARVAVPAFVGVPVDPAVAGFGSFGRKPYMFQIEQATRANLLNYPDAPPPVGLRLKPEIAAAMPTLSRDRRTYTFRIRPGYRFSPPSGEPVTAESFRASIERALSPRFGADAPAVRLLGDVVGARTYHEGRARRVSGVRAHGSTLSITLTKPSADFLERLSLPVFSPVPDDTPPIANGEWPDGAREPGPPSAGPYYIATHVGVILIILRRNPYYRGPRPHALDAIGFIEGLPADTALARFLHGTSDLVELPDPALHPTGPLARRYRSAASATSPSYHATTLEQTHFVALNARHGLFANRRLRQAAAYALNRTALADLWGVTMDGLPSTGKLDASGQLLPPNVRDFQRAAPYPLGPDLRRALKLAHGHHGVAAMALPNGCDECAHSLELVRAALAPIGFDVRGRRVASLAAMRSHPADFDLFDATTVVDYPDPASFLEQMLGRDVPRAWLPATTRSGVRGLDRLREDARDAAAVKLAARIETSDVPVVAIGHPVIGQLFSPHLGCRVFTGSRFGVDLASLCRR